MPSTNRVAPDKLFIYRGRREPADTHLVPTNRIIVAKEIVLTTNTNWSPIAVCLLFRIVDLILCDICFVVLWVLFGPVWMLVGAHFASRACATVYWRFAKHKAVYPVWACRVCRQR